MLKKAVVDCRIWYINPTSKLIITHMLHLLTCGVVSKDQIVSFNVNESLLIYEHVSDVHIIQPNFRNNKTWIVNVRAISLVYCLLEGVFVIESIEIEKGPSSLYWLNIRWVSPGVLIYWNCFKNIKWFIKVVDVILIIRILYIPFSFIFS